LSCSKTNGAPPGDQILLLWRIQYWDISDERSSPLDVRFPDSKFGAYAEAVRSRDNYGSRQGPVRSGRRRASNRSERRLDAAPVSRYTGETMKSYRKVAGQAMIDNSVGGTCLADIEDYYSLPMSSLWLIHKVRPTISWKRLLSIGQRPNRKKVTLFECGGCRDDRRSAFVPGAVHSIPDSRSRLRASMYDRVMMGR